MTAADSRKIDILYVEDDRAFAELCSVYLEREGDTFSIQWEGKPSDALKVFKSNAIDCIVSDYDMGEMHGLEFLKAVRTHNEDVPFILFTGKGSEAVASEAISFGLTDYLQKGGGVEQYSILANRIKNAVESHRRQQEAQRYHTQLDAIARHSSDAIIVMDGDSRIHYANPAVIDHFGYAPDEIRDKRLTALMPERLRDRHVSGVDRYIRTGEKSVNWTAVDFNGIHKEGHEIPLSVSYGEYQREGEQRFIGIIRQRVETDAPANTEEK